MLGAVTAAVYMIGSGRVFGYDSAVTFANFIATPSLLDAFAVHAQQPTIPIAQIAGNDHVLVSLLSHLIYSVSGSRSEVVYRLLPALAAGGVAGVTAGALATRFGMVAGACAGLFVAANPMFIENSRDLRGYSVATLCGLLATVLFFMPARLKARRWLAVYGALLGLAIAAHAYAGLVPLAHVAWVIARRAWPDFWRLMPAWVLGAAVAIAANGYILWVDVTQHGLLPQLFDPTFPLDVAIYLLGAPSLLALGLWLSAAGLGLWVVRRELLVWVAAGLLVTVVLLLWHVVEPFYLYPRFFVVVVPAAAYLVAAAVKRWIVLAPVVIAGAVAAAITVAPNYEADPLALRQAASLVAAGDAAGKKVCLIHSDEQVLGAYAASGFTVVTEAGQLQACDEVLIVSWGVDIPIRDEAAKEFPNATRIPAVYPTVILTR